MPKKVGQTPIFTKTALILSLLFFIIFTTIPASAHWPTTVREDFPFAAYPDSSELSGRVLSLSEGRTLFTFWREYRIYYNIIDKYGEFVFPQDRLLADTTDPYLYDPKYLFSDNHGGAISVWYVPIPTILTQGIYAQRLDSLGNRLWGDQGIRFLDFEVDASFDASSDGKDGLLLFADRAGSLYINRYNGSGQPVWGVNGLSLPINYGIRHTQICHDGANGALIVWSDYRPPYGPPYGAIYIQRIDSLGNFLLSPNSGVLVVPDCDDVNELLPDGLGGCLLYHKGIPGSIRRIAPNGNVLWHSLGHGWFTPGTFINGERGFFYLCVSYNEGVYAQRIDIHGNNHWTANYPNGMFRANLMMSRLGWGSVGNSIAYKDSILYGLILWAENPNSLTTYATAQSLDISGNRLLGEGIILSRRDHPTSHWLTQTPSITASAQSHIQHHHHHKSQHYT